MRETLYAVVRHRGKWSIRVCGAEFFACENYRMALDVALTAADLLARQRAERANAHARDRTADNAPARPPSAMPRDDALENRHSLFRKTL